MTDLETNTVHTGDCLEVLADLPAESVHAVVTDPPYGLAFMGRSWDDFEPKEYQRFCEEWAAECLRVLKPGGHLLAFSGDRTHHRAFAGVEDAGFEIRDTITWHYGSGFPKASDISKTIDKRADAEREVTGTEYKAGGDRNTMNVTGNNGRVSEGASLEGVVERTEPATDAATKWDGFKTALKPATEYVVMARKPFDGATVDCVLEHGTGALNVDGCRVGNESTTVERDDDSAELGYMGGGSQPANTGSENGRYPSNVVFDAQQAAELDRQTDDTVSTGGVPNGDETDERVGNFRPNVQASTGGLGDSGGVSRYFYTSKASKAERTLDGKIENAHPTVKPPDLMEWLVTLVTREGQIVLDPFAGSGTTCRAARDLKREFVGIEKQAKWADVARVRCGLTPDDASVVRPDGQGGLEQF